jgi:hypothetical protein
MPILVPVHHPFHLGLPKRIRSFHVHLSFRSYNRFNLELLRNGNFPVHLSRNENIFLFPYQQSLDSTFPSQLCATYRCMDFFSSSILRYNNLGNLTGPMTFPPAPLGFLRSGFPNFKCLPQEQQLPLLLNIFLFLLTLQCPIFP